MNTQLERSAGYAAIVSGIFAILALVTSVLFFGLEAPSIGTSTTQTHFWGPLSDLTPILQMLPLLVVAYALFLEQRRAAPMPSIIAAIIGATGMLGVIVLQSLLLLHVIPFEQEVGPVVFATGMVGVWLVVVNYLERHRKNLPSRLTWLGMVVGIAFALEPVLLAPMGGTVNWQTIVSNSFLLIGSVLVFLVAYVGFPIWVIWLGRLFMANRREPTTELKPARQT
jgi:hypothetical protein